MGLDTAIIHHKEYRKQYRKSKLFDRTCRNHGSCIYCYSNRMYKNKKRLQEADVEKLIEELLQEYSNLWLSLA